MSDATLDMELAAFEEIDATYAGLAEQVAAAVREARSTEPNSDLWTEIALLIAGASAAVAVIVNRLIGDTVNASIGSLSTELGLVEASMAAPYAGLAAVAVSTVAVDDLVAQAADGFTTETDGITAYALTEAKRIEELWRRAQEDRDALVERLTAEEVRRPGQTGRGIVRRPATVAQQRARAVAVGAGNDARGAAMEAFNAEASDRGADTDSVYKQVVAKIDSRTTVVCLHAAGQIRPLDEPFDTLNGDVQVPPFHWGCRSVIIPWAPGMIQRYRDEANTELRARPIEERRLGPDGEIGGRVPGLPEPAEVVPLPDDLAANPGLPIDDVPPEHRVQYMRANAARFDIHSNQKGSWWVKDGDRRYNLRQE